MRKLVKPVIGSKQRLYFTASLMPHFETLVRDAPFPTDFAVFPATNVDPDKKRGRFGNFGEALAYSRLDAPCVNNKEARHTSACVIAVNTR